MTKQGAKHVLGAWFEAKMELIEAVHQHNFGVVKSAKEHEEAAWKALEDLRKAWR